ncbi:hypothetical protein ACP70R_046598 [Stipagrostis hirtigluma subsp. patula]
MARVGGDATRVLCTDCLNMLDRRATTIYRKTRINTVETNINDNLAKLMVKPKRISLFLAGVSSRGSLECHIILEALFEHHLFDEMPSDPEPAAGTRRGSRRVPVAPSLQVEDWARLGIDDLPRDVLLRVLSRLDARQLVRTCAVSPRWRDLWRDVPRVNATRHEFEVDGDGGGDYDARNPLFKEFVNRLLMLRNPVALEEFRLEYSIGPELMPDCAEANLWIGHALLCSARSVEVFVWGDTLMLDPAVARSVEVFVWGDTLMLDPAVFTSKHLKSLLFCAVALTRGFFSQLQTGCKALERLILQDCPINDTEISSQTLKILSIGSNCYFLSRDQVSISTPGLIHLGFFDHAFYDRIPLLKNMESLVTAYISVGTFKSIQVDDICQFLHGLSGVRKLEFHFVEIQLNMEKNLQWCPKFLTLGEWCLHADSYALIVFLQNSPNLVNLTLNLKQPFHAPGRLMGELGDRSFKCKHLKNVQIICAESNPVVDSLEKFLLGNGITSGQIQIKNKM